MKIVIIGAKGNLGSQLYSTLSLDHEVYAFDKQDFDVLDFNKLELAIKEVEPDLLVNCVAYNNVDKCEDNEYYQIALKLNRDLPAKLAELALKYQFTLAHYSSDYVFSGSEEKTDFLENETPNPINKYGESKFLGELEIEKLASRGLQYYIIRTSKLFGPSSDNPLSKPSFFDIMLKLSQEKNELMAVNEELSCFTYTPDLALASAQIFISRSSYGIYHLVNENPVTWYDAGVTLFNLAKRKVNLRSIRSEDMQRAARRPKFSVLKNTKAKKLRPYQDALKEYINTILCEE